MSEQENVQIVKGAYAAFMRGDIPAILNTLADSVVWFLPGPTEVIPVAGERRGREQVKEFFSTLDETQEALQFEPKEFIAQAEKVVVLGNYRWRIKSTGREAASDWVHVFTLRDGKVVEFREFYDTAAVSEAYRATSAQAAQTT